MKRMKWKEEGRVPPMKDSFELLFDTRKTNLKSDRKGSIVPIVSNMRCSLMAKSQANTLIFFGKSEFQSCVFGVCFQLFS